MDGCDKYHTVEQDWLYMCIGKEDIWEVIIHINDLLHRCLYCENSPGCKQAEANFKRLEQNKFPHKFITKKPLDESL